MPHFLESADKYFKFILHIQLSKVISFYTFSIEVLYTICLYNPLEELKLCLVTEGHYVTSSLWNSAESFRVEGPTNNSALNFLSALPAYKICLPTFSRCQRPASHTCFPWSHVHHVPPLYIRLIFPGVYQRQHLKTTCYHCSYICLSSAQPGEVGCHVPSFTFSELSLILSRS